MGRTVRAFHLKKDYNGCRSISKIFVTVRAFHLKKDYN